MINSNMRNYNFFTFGEENEYGQPILSAEPQGSIKMAVEVASQSIQDNINYSGSQYVGLTHAEINDSYVIEYRNNIKLKVLYVNPRGRLKQVFMAEM